MPEKSLDEMIVEYVSLTDDIISGKSAKPAFSQDSLTKTAEVLAQSRLMDKKDSEQFVKDLSENPGKALSVIQKLAEKMSKTATISEHCSLGKPLVDGSKLGNRPVRESDRFLYSKFNLI